MARKYVGDEFGKYVWFDPDECEEFGTDISSHHGNRTPLRTPGGRWILQTHLNSVGIGELPWRYSLISEREAAEILLQANGSIPDCLRGALDEVPIDSECRTGPETVATRGDASAGHKSPPLASRWVWDLYPLSEDAWGNQLWPCDDASIGECVIVTRNKEVRPEGNTFSYGFAFRVAMSVLNPEIEERRFYVPTQADLSLIQQWFPGEDAQRPPWLRIKAELMLVGHTPQALVTSEAPVLLAFLARAQPQRNVLEVADAFHTVLQQCDEAIQKYSVLRPELLNQVILLKTTIGGPWKIRYKRNPKEGDLDAPVKVVHQLGELKKIGDVAVKGFAATRHPETYAPFHDFEFFNAEGLNPASGTEADHLRRKMAFLLEQLLETVKSAAKSLKAVEEMATATLPQFEIRPLTELALALPVFPYWATIGKGATKENHEAIIENERGLISRARLVLHQLQTLAPVRSKQLAPVGMKATPQLSIAHSHAVPTALPDPDGKLTTVADAERGAVVPEAVISQVRRILTDWDGTNWAAVRAHLRLQGWMAEEIGQTTLFDVRMAFHGMQVVHAGPAGTHIPSVQTANFGQDDSQRAGEKRIDGIDDLVSLDEAAAISHRSKRTLQNYIKNNQMPPPYQQGGGGKPSLWKWCEIRPFLEENFVKGLPERFPRNIR